MKKLFSLIFIVLLFSAAAVPATFGAVSDPFEDELLLELEATRGAIYGSTSRSAELPELIGGIIKGLLGIVGVILVVLIIYAGFLYMTAHGESEQVEKAKKIIKNAVIGLIIIIAAYSLTVFVVDAIIGAATT